MRNSTFNTTNPHIHIKNKEKEPLCDHEFNCSKKNNDDKITQNVRVKGLLSKINVDKSTDKSDELVQSICKKNKNIFFLEMGKRFGSAERNFYHLFKEVNFSNFDYVCLSDQDDIWLENKVYRAITCIIENNCEAYSSNATAFWESGKKINTDKKYFT